MDSLGARDVPDRGGALASLYLARHPIQYDMLQSPETWQRYARGWAASMPQRRVFEVLVDACPAAGPKVTSEVLYALHQRSAVRWWWEVGVLGDDQWEVFFDCCREYTKFEVRLNRSFRLGVCDLKARELSYQGLQVCSLPPFPILFFVANPHSDPSQPLCTLMSPPHTL